MQTKLLHQEHFLVILHHFIITRILESLSVLSKFLDHRFSLTEAAIEVFLENSYTCCDRQIILLNIVLLRSSFNAQAAYWRDLGKVR